MKILDKEEREAHIQHITAEGAKGLVYGGIVLAGLFTLAKYMYPAKFKSWNTLIKTALVIIPTIGIAAFWADQGLWEFDKRMHHRGQERQRTLDEYRKWNRSSTLDKVMILVDKHPLQILVGTLALGAFAWKNTKGSHMTKVPQKVYAQGAAAAVGLAALLYGNHELVKKKRQEEMQTQVSNNGANQTTVDRK